MKLSGGGKLGAIALVLMIGLMLQGRWTGQTFKLDLLNRNALGDLISGKDASSSSSGGIPQGQNLGGVAPINPPAPSVPASYPVSYSA